MTFERLKFLLIIFFCYSILDSITIIVADEKISSTIPNADSSPATKNTLIINSSKLEYFPIEYTSVFETNDNKLNIEDIDFIGEKYWKPLKPNFEFNIHTIYWLKLNLQLDDKDKQAQILEWIISPGFWFDASIFIKKEKSKIDGKPSEWTVHNLSVFTPLSERIIKHNIPLIDLFKDSQKQQLFLKLQGFRHGRKSEFRHIKISSLKKLRFDDQKELYFQGTYLGIAIALVGFHFVLWLWFREKSYFWLVLMGAVSPIFFHAIYGFGITHLWPSLIVWNEYSASLLGIITASFYLRFSAVYLNLEIQYPRINFFLSIGIVISLMASLSVFYDMPAVIKFAPLLQTVLSLVILWVSIKLSLQGHRHAWYFVAGNALILFSFILWSLSQTNMINIDYLPVSVSHLTQVAASIQGVLLALGMVDRMQSMRQVILETQLLKEKQEKQQSKKMQHLMKIQNAELASANYALKEVDQLKDEFLAKTSHELNTPLNGIIGLSEVLLSDDNIFTIKEREEYLELIVSRGQHLRDLVLELLEFTKTKRDVVKLYPESFDVTSHIQKILLGFESMATKKGLKLIFEEQTDAFVFADVRRFRQIISILIDNAIKYTQTGNISLAIVNKDTSTEIRISDTGVGIETSDLQSIFEPFKQVSKIKKIREGAGLGLSICKHLVELHNGKIEIKSVIGKGSTFSVIFPSNEQFKL
ncbi:MAG: hypothetical protein COA86_13330 [Kangiella sp.]|nr:MAG: hypothetical protein COA86_13330 [Kangiella sp.]